MLTFVFSSSRRPIPFPLIDHRWVLPAEMTELRHLLQPPVWTITFTFLLLRPAYSISFRSAVAMPLWLSRSVPSIYTIIVTESLFLPLSFVYFFLASLATSPFTCV